MALMPVNGWAEITAPASAKQSAAIAIDKDTVKAKIDTLNVREGIDEGIKSKVLKLYHSVEDNLANIEGFKTQVAEFKASLQQAPDTTKKLQKEIEQAQRRLSKQTVENFNQIPMEELEQRLILEKENLSNLDAQISKLENDLAVQNTRPQLIRQQMLSAKQELEAAQQKLGATSASPETKLEIEAKQLYLKVLIDARTAELKMLDVEAISNPARVELLKAELQLRNIQKSILSPVILAIENVMSERRQQEAREMQQALTQIEKETSGKHPLIQQVTRDNIRYSRDLQTITGKLEQYTERKAAIDNQATEIESDFKSAEKKISLAGLSPALGKILREQRRNLTTPKQFSQQSETIQNETAQTSLAQFSVEDRLKPLVDIDAELKRMIGEQVDPALPINERMMIQAELRVLLNNQKELLNKLSVAYTTYLRTLGDFDFARQQLTAQAEKFAKYLDERLLWVPSSKPIDLGYITGLYESTKWLLSPLNWVEVLKDSIKICLRSAFLAMLALISLGVSMALRIWAKRQVSSIAGKIGKIYTDNFYYTVRALVYTLLRVLPAPLFIFYLGWFLSRDAGLFDFSKAIGAGLQGASVPLFILQFLYQLFAEQGIARIHFQWKKESASLLRKEIAWIRFIAVLGVFLINCTGAASKPELADNLGRLALIVMMLAMSVFFSRIFKPATGVLSTYFMDYPEPWLSRLRYVWYPALTAIPLVVAGFAIAGYYLSALELQQKLIVTLRLCFATLIVHELVIRWLTLVNRQLAIKNIRQKRKTAAESAKHPRAGGEDPVLPTDDQLIDIPTINAQTIKLLNVCIGFSLIVGTWMIWKNILPAFSFLDNIELWQHLATIDNQETYQPTTLTNLLLAGLYVFIAVVALRNFSGVMELLVFRRLSIEAGSRYAVNQLAKYLLISIGFICVANELGGSWSQVQWLVAALSVGLGFGLQEIFANLVSGIILLFERPIRVGDTVTIGDVSGKVSRIHMRATTVIDWDQKELIVPNKTFITSQLINWTLSDAITRVVIPVGIAYGSDVKLAHQVMLDTVRSMPLVLSEPEPSVLFLGFGDSSLDFSIRIYVNELGHRLPATHDLHFRLDQAFRENNIEIPFPQRDIHVRSFVQESDQLINHLKSSGTALVESTRASPGIL